MRDGATCAALPAETVIFVDSCFISTRFHFRLNGDRRPSYRLPQQTALPGIVCFLLASRLVAGCILLTGTASS